jgi:hypothetical protein
MQLQKLVHGHRPRHVDKEDRVREDRLRSNSHIQKTSEFKSHIAKKLNFPRLIIVFCFSSTDCNICSFNLTFVRSCSPHLCCTFASVGFALT